jgi:pilus assembly protein TadC
MKHDTVLLLIRYLPLICGVLAAVMVLFFFAGHTERAVLSAYREISGLVIEKSMKTGWYTKTERMLKRTGASFRSGGRLTTGSFLAFRLLSSLAGFVVGSRISVAAGLVLIVPSSFVPMFIINRLNKRDNEKMLTDIKLVYNSLATQIRAGINISDALTECYGCAGYGRFRKALMELASDIVINSDIFDALEKFQGKFDNRYVDALCITVLQALESGQAVELLADISEQIKDMEASLLEKRKGRLDRSVTFYQLGILGAILAVILYACVKYMLSAALKF